MGKRRIIDSKIRTSQSFASFTYRQRDLWQGLIATADDQGRMPGTPAYIRSTIWPFDDISLKEVENDLQALVLAGNIVIYFVGESGYLQIVNWWKYQQGQWAAPSDYPPPIGWQDRARYHGKGNQLFLLSWNSPGGYVLPSSNTPPPQDSNQDSGQDSNQDNPLTRRDEDEDVNKDKDEEEDLKGAAAPAAFILDPDRQAEALFCEATEFPCIPPGEIKRIDQLVSMIRAYGYDMTLKAVKTNYQIWRKKPRKNGSGTYSGTNLGYVDWAMDALNGNGPGEKSIDEMTDKEFVEYCQRKAQEAQT